jgi:hypothetical protein
METADQLTFAERVAALRASWQDTRTAARFGAARDRETQYVALQLVYEWARAAVDQIEAVYGAHLDLRISPLRPIEHPEPGFVVEIEDFAAVAASLAEMKPGEDRWHVTIATRVSGERTWAIVAPDRRHSFWTRSRVEDVLLSLLSALERARSRHERGAGRKSNEAAFSAG